MQVIILAGGKGTRLAEETTARPKPMVEVGGKPIIWHIMNIYASYGFKDFLVACGYRGEQIKAYFHDLALHSADYMMDLKNGSRDVVNSCELDWRVGLIDTGLESMTGGRLLRLRSWTGGAAFMATYGDGVANINICELLAFHRSHRKLATISAVRPPSRFGALQLDGDSVQSFSEKPQAGEGWINGGFFVFEPGIFDYISGDSSILEREVLEQVAADGQLKAFRHPGFFQPMDTMREKHLLEDLWAAGKAPWKTWV